MNSGHHPLCTKISQDIVCEIHYTTQYLVLRIGKSRNHQIQLDKGSNISVFLAFSLFFKKQFSTIFDSFRHILSIFMFQGLLNRYI